MISGFQEENFKVYDNKLYNYLNQARNMKNITFLKLLQNITGYLNSDFNTEENLRQKQKT